MRTSTLLDKRCLRATAYSDVWHFNWVCCIHKHGTCHWSSLITFITRAPLSAPVGDGGLVSQRRSKSQLALFFSLKSSLDFLTHTHKRHAVETHEMKYFLMIPQADQKRIDEMSHSVKWFSLFHAKGTNIDCNLNICSFGPFTHAKLKIHCR